MIAAPLLLEAVRTADQKSSVKLGLKTAIDAAESIYEQLGSHSQNPLFLHFRSRSECH